MSAMKTNNTRQARSPAAAPIIALTAVCALALLAVYCTQMEYDNPLDPKADNYSRPVITFNANGGTFGDGATAVQRTVDSRHTMPNPLPTPTRDGYTFEGNWYSAATGGNVVNLNREFSGDTTVWARWTGDGPPTTYTLTTSVTPSGGGTVSRSPDAASYAAGTSVTVTATAANGYTFTGWSGASTLTSSSVTVTMSQNWSLTANFQLQQQNPVTGTFTDARDNQSYPFVTIGGKTWMAKNLNYQTASGSYCYGDNPSNCDTYGRLYTWEAAMNGSSSSSLNPSGVQGVCPAGWHLPSDAEWTELVNAVGSSAGTKLKSTSGWDSGGNGTDDFGFSALPGGYRYSDGLFYNAGHYGYWWSATEFAAGYAWVRGMHYDYDYVIRDSWDKTNALSVRCVRD